MAPMGPSLRALGRSRSQSRTLAEAQEATTAGEVGGPSLQGLGRRCSRAATMTQRISRTICKLCGSLVLRLGVRSLFCCCVLISPCAGFPISVSAPPSFSECEWPLTLLCDRSDLNSHERCMLLRPLFRCMTSDHRGFTAHILAARLSGVCRGACEHTLMHDVR